MMRIATLLVLITAAMILAMILIAGCRLAVPGTNETTPTGGLTIDLGNVTPTEEKPTEGAGEEISVPE